MPKTRPAVAKQVSLCTLIREYDVCMHSVQLYFFKIMYIEATIAALA